MMEKIKVSDIRAKFPMYADLSDEQLLIGIRKRFYPDIPMPRFAALIDFDTQRDALGKEVVGDTNTFLAGAGKAFTDLARGAGQALGVVSRRDVADSRANDSALMSTTGGKIGNIVGNVASLAPTALIPGAGTYAGASTIGAISGALQPSESTEETVKNLAIGGLLAPAGIVATRAAASGGNAIRGLVEPFTKKGQEAISARTLQQFATDPSKARAALSSAKPLVPGSIPTMAQASGDAGLAQLERTLVNNPESGKILAGRFADQRAARLAAVQEIAGTDDYYNAIKSGRDVFAREDYARAMSEGIDREMSIALKPQIKSLMERPSIQQAKREALSLAREQNIAVKDFGSIEGLDWLKKGLDSLISSAKKPGSSISNERLRSLVQTKQDLMSVIEDVAPAYKAANDNFAGMSRNINSMDAARGLLDRMQSPLARFGANTREMKNEYARALEAATESVKKTTGMDRPLSQVMNPRDVRALNAVAEDMARAAKAEDLGRAVGSNTAQNLAAQNLLRRTLGPSGLPQSWSESNALQAFLSPYTGVAKLAGSEQAILDRIAAAALDPLDAAFLLGSSATRGSMPQGLLRYAPVAPLSLPYAQQ